MKSEKQSKQEEISDLSVLDRWLKSAHETSPRDIETALEQVYRKAEEKPRRNFTRFYIYAAAAAASIVLAITLGLTLGKPAPEVNTCYRYANAESSPKSIILPDGTEVWLRNGASIEYDSSFNTSDRNVRFSGEAYFNVAKNKELPFCVITPDFRVRVHGTIFNLNTRADAPEVILAQGSVAVQNAAGDNILRLKPGQKATLDTTGGFFDIEEVPVGDILLANYGVISLKGVTADEIASAVEKHFGVTLKADGASTSTLYDFNFQRASTAESVVELLNFICTDQKFTITEK